MTTPDKVTPLSEEDWKLVPVDPTPKMVEAGRKAMEPEKFVSHYRTMAVWQSMVDAAPRQFSREREDKILDNLVDKMADRCIAAESNAATLSSTIAALEKERDELKEDRDMWMEIVAASPKTAVIIDLRAEVVRLMSKHAKWCSAVVTGDPYGECNCRVGDQMLTPPDEELWKDRATLAEASLAKVVGALRPFADEAERLQVYYDSLGKKAEAAKSFPDDARIDMLKGVYENLRIKHLRAASEALSSIPAAAKALLEGQRTAFQTAAKIAEEYWPGSDDPTDEPNASIRRDAGLSIAAAIRAKADLAVGERT